jgi:hypothetical protein
MGRNCGACSLPNRISVPCEPLVSARKCGGVVPAILLSRKTCTISAFTISPFSKSLQVYLCGPAGSRPNLRLIASVREQLEQVVIRYAKGETSNEQFRHTLPSRVGGYCTRF